MVTFTYYHNTTMVYGLETFVILRLILSTIAEALVKFEKSSALQ